MLKIQVFPTEPEQHARALNIAEQLQLPLLTDLSQADGYVLLVARHQLALQAVNTRSTPFSIDFLAKKLTYRRQNASLRRETLARALGLKQHSTPTIVDATAGLGRDSIIIAALGFQVTLLERSPLVALLLNDGMQRALQDSQVAPIIQRMQLVQTEAVTWLRLQSTTNCPEIIYLDPMYPHREKSALAKKDMQVFQAIIGADSDSDQLLPAALSCATKRVVVKRPRLAENLAGIAPSFSQEGSSSRFDIYLT